jgi:hypothetical protein
LNPITRFFESVEADESGCLVWTGTRNEGGYGVFYVDGKHCLAHRWLFDRLYGDPAPLVADHLCRNRACVRPGHIELVTRAENNRRGDSGTRSRERTAAITHCPRGHAYDDENTHVYVRGAYRCRRCRVCGREGRRSPDVRARDKATLEHRRFLNRFEAGDELVAVSPAGLVAVKVYDGTAAAEVERIRRLAVSSYLDAMREVRQP